MLENATQNTRQLAVGTPYGEDILLLNRFHGKEQISRLFEYELEMISADDSLDPAKIVGQNVTWLLSQGLHEPRFFNGYVSRFRYVNQNDHGTTYRATIVPWLWFLTRTRDCRIFQNKNVQEIVTDIFEDLGFQDYRWLLTGGYESREYCVQYRETDMDFVSRLLEEEGIYFYYTHENGRHTVVLADTAASYFKLPESEVEFGDPDGEGDLADQITAWEHHYEFQPGRWAQTDYNFKTPLNSLMAVEQTGVEWPNNKNFEIYDYPGRFENTSASRRFTRIRMEEHELPHDRVSGQSTYRGFTPGGTLTVKTHRSDAEVGKRYVLTSVEISVGTGGSYDGHHGHNELMFANRFECIPAETTYRPARVTPRPIVEGPQTAVIVGPPGEEIYPDEYGRVKVQFHWDRVGQFNENSSCWLRVSQVHAGQGWGMIDLPRIGEEVIVGFLEGDPDAPIIIGRVYNAVNMPPYKLPEGKTRRGNTTKTHKGAGYNEMTMDDTKGKEQIRVNAQYDMNSNVNHDQTLDVGNNQSENVGVDRARTVGNNESIDVGVNKSVNIGSNHTETVGVNQNITVGSNQTTSIGSNKQETVGMMYNELVGVSRTSSIGVANALTVGAAMNVAIGFVSTEQVGMKKSTIVGSDYSISVGSKFQITCGASKLTMEAGGKITIEGTELLLAASGPVNVVGSVIDLN